MTFGGFLLFYFIDGHSTFLYIPTSEWYAYKSDDWKFKKLSIALIQFAYTSAYTHRDQSRIWNLYFVWATSEQFHFTNEALRYVNKALSIRYILYIHEWEEKINKMIKIFGDIPRADENELYEISTLYNTVRYVRLYKPGGNRSFIQIQIFFNKKPPWQSVENNHMAF